MASARKIICLLAMFASFCGWASELPVLEGKKIELRGVLTQGTLLSGNLGVGGELTLNGETVRITPDGQFVIGFGRDAALEQRISWKKLGAKFIDQVIYLEPRKYNEQRVNGVAKKMVTPDASKIARIKLEALLVKTARTINSDLGYFFEKFIQPLNGPITGVYGSRRIFNGTPKRPHYGLDYAAPVGALVYAPASGVVTMNHDDMYYSGGTLIIDHGYGVSSTFLHLSKLLVKEGDVIEQGDVIAKVGKGGRSTGPHLDWRVNWYGVRIDPQLVLKRYE